MHVKYFGRMTKDCLGELLYKPMPPCASITYKDAETDVLIARLNYTGYQYDLFGNGSSDNMALVGITDRQDYEDFMEVWKESRGRK